MHGQLAITVRAVVERDVKSLGVAFHPIHIFVNVGSIDDDEIVLMSHLVDEQVIYGATVGVAHHAIVYFALWGVLDVVGEYVVYIFFGVWTAYAYFAHV